jgi:hypothetical protein
LLLWRAAASLGTSRDISLLAAFANAGITWLYVSRVIAIVE